MRLCSVLRKTDGVIMSWVGDRRKGKQGERRCLHGERINPRPVQLRACKLELKCPDIQFLRGSGIVDQGDLSRLLHAPYCIEKILASYDCLLASQIPACSFKEVIKTAENMIIIEWI